ncbi:YcjX family protein [uncultured Umboniibacter sp.]|uniref:YcjX family protein n=1 Tax=uncultured Umboniibacter sp. TaxID=1798917 RepID=UPI0026264798|nr:YcjX family protein [uncultured Umboniibacter sp.]
MKLSKSSLRRKLSQVGSSFDDLVDQGKSLTSHHWERLRHQRLKVGVAGLSGAGKSTFITSLIAQLRGFDEATLTSLSASVEGRLRAVELLALSKHREVLTAFAVDQFLHELDADEPNFPPSTQQPSAIDIRINYVSRKGKRKALTLELTDFPGEWLVDTALLKMSYSEWNSWQTKIWSQTEQNEITAMLGRLQLGVDTGTEGGSDAEARHSEASSLCFPSDELLSVFAQYRNFLQSKRSESGGTLYTPGQVTVPNDSVDVFPVPIFNVDDSDRSKALLTLMESRYNEYVKTSVKPFYENHIKGLDRQVLLVDVQSVLHHGKKRKEEVSEALALIMGQVMFTEAHSLMNWLSPHVDKIMIYATKADLVLPEDHEEMRRVVQQVAQDTIRYTQTQGASVHVEAVAAMRVTRYSREETGEFLTARTAEGEFVRFQNPTLIGADSLNYDSFKQYALPQLQPRVKHGVPEHLRMDVAIEQILGDWLR